MRVQVEGKVRGSGRRGGGGRRAQQVVVARGRLDVHWRGAGLVVVVVSIEEGVAVVVDVTPEGRGGRGEKGGRSRSGGAEGNLHLKGVAGEGNSSN